MRTMPGKIPGLSTTSMIVEYLHHDVGTRNAVVAIHCISIFNNRHYRNGDYKDTKYF
jgi:hypothetical protein